MEVHIRPVQAAWRGILARRRYSRRGRAAHEIQSAWRLHRLRASLLQQLEEARRQRDLHFQALQQQLRDSWPRLQNEPHVVVHVLSMHYMQPMALAQKVRGKTGSCAPMPWSTSSACTVYSQWHWCRK